MAISSRVKMETPTPCCIPVMIKPPAGPAGDTYGLERAKGGRHASIMKYNLNQLAKS